MAGISRLVTVFGGSGFLGQEVVSQLVAQGTRVRVAVRNPSSLHPSALGPEGHIESVTCDITDKESVANALHGSDAAVNLVGILYESGRSRTFDGMHHVGAKNIAEAAAAGGLNALVHVSAIGADASSPSGYARSKAAGEKAVLTQFPSAVILRPSVVFGERDNFFNQFADMARFLPILPVMGLGHTSQSSPALLPQTGAAHIHRRSQWGGVLFQPVYVGDVASAIVASLDPDGAAMHPPPSSSFSGQRIYELGGPDVYDFANLMEVVMKYSGRRRLLFPIPRPVALVQGTLLGLLPHPLLTLDQVLLMDRDNVVSGTLPTLAELNLNPTSVDEIVPTYLGGGK